MYKDLNLRGGSIKCVGGHDDLKVTSVNIGRVVLCQ